ncbi:MAG: DUF2975 domain-containing protein [Clostridia bacterium]|nr:DUF2975 domain-containing protein [Clostridia bacterium]
MIKKSFSATLTLVLCYVFSACLAFMCAFAPTVFRWYFVGYRNLPSVATTVTVTFYVCVPFAAIALSLLIKTLLRIKKREVLVSKNVSAMRGLSWCCVAVCVITGVAGIIYFPFFFIFAASGFFALILRVIKNVFAYAVDVKDENDYTI